MERLSKTIFLLFALLFALLGICFILPMSLPVLAFIPKGAEHFFHLMAAAGLLLAASLSLQCAVSPAARQIQHPLLLAFGTLVCLDITRRDSTAGMVSWILLALYALPLLRLLPKRSSVGPLEPGQFEGTVKWFNPNKGFGFILTSDEREVFVHFKALSNGGRRSLHQGQTVRFSIRNSERGEQAENVLILR